MRFQALAPASIPVRNAWKHPDGSSLGLSYDLSFAEGDITEDFPEDHVLYKALRQHPNFKPYERPTAWERLLREDTP